MNYLALNEAFLSISGERVLKLPRVKNVKKNNSTCNLKDTKKAIMNCFNSNQKLITKNLTNNKTPTSMGKPRLFKEIIPQTTLNSTNREDRLIQYNKTPIYKNRATPVYILRKAFNYVGNKRISIRVNSSSQKKLSSPKESSLCTQESDPDLRKKLYEMYMKNIPVTAWDK